MVSGSSANETYTRLWAEAADHFQNGLVGIDPYLRDKEKDRRLGLSVIGRPDPAVGQQFVAFLNQVKLVAPNQYFYRASEFHLTVLSLFTATEAFERHWRRLVAYRSAVDQALSNGQALTVHYRGITASKNAVMIQGFVQGSQLAQMRASLRQALGAAGLAEGLDQRYAIETAHSTVLRFSSQPEDLAKLFELFGQNRTTDFGKTTYRELQLVKNDWYMSQDKVEVLAQYFLPHSP
jgi:2'-5' RNA ligase